MVGDLRCQFFRIEWLGEYTGDGKCFQLLSFGGESLGSEQENRDVGGKQVRFEHTESSPPVGTRHFHIKENRVRLFHDGLGYSFAGVLSFRHSPLRK